MSHMLMRDSMTAVSLLEVDFRFRKVSTDFITARLELETGATALLLSRGEGEVKSMNN